MKHEDLYKALIRTKLHTFMKRAFGQLKPGDTFIDGVYLRAMCRALEKVESGETRRLIIALPPRHLKSHCTSVAFTAWLLGRNPTKEIICASYSSALSEDFSLQARQLMEAPWYRAIFPKTKLSPSKKSVKEFRTTRNGKRLATSVGGTLTGRGGDITIIDDPMKAEDAHSETKRAAVLNWFKSTVSTRKDDPKTGAIIVVAQRLHEDDLIGNLLQTGDWDILELPSIATRHQELDLGDGVHWDRAPDELLHPERFGQKELDEARREIGSSAFEAQHQQRPAPAGGNLIKTEWFGTYEGTPELASYEAIVQSWDTASVPGESNDWSVCTTWGLLGNQIYLLDVHREQYIYPDLLRVAQQLRKQWKPKLVIIELAVSGISLHQDLKRLQLNDVRGLSCKVSKVERLVAETPKLEAGQVRLPKSAPWLAAFQAEVAAFPNGKHDDQVDSMSQMLKALDLNPNELRGISRYIK